MRYLYLVFGLLCGATAFAQNSNSTTFILPHVEADNNTEVCMPVTAINFSSGVEFSFALKWEKPEDGGALTLNRVQNLSPNIPFFGMEDFNIVDYVSDGLITVQWGNYPNGQTCRDANGRTVTLPDGEVLFEVCFDVLGPVASNHVVEFFNKPDDDIFDGVDDSVDIVFNKPPQCNAGNDAFPGDEAGSVTIGVKPFILTIPDVQGNYQLGDTYCVNINVESGFEAIKGFQFGLQFDSTVIRSVSNTINPNFPPISNTSFNRFRGSSLYAVWFATNDTPYSIADGETLFTACFEIVGDCRDRTDIVPGEVVTNPGMQLRVSDVNGENVSLASIPFIGKGTRLIIDDCNPAGFDVIVDCPDVQVNYGDTEVCVQIRAGDDFVNMTDIDYLINFDPAVLEYTTIEQRNPTMNLDVARHFVLTGADNGVIGFDWSANGTQRKTLMEDDVVFAVCFNAIGFGGTSPIVISDFRNEIESSDGFFDGINPTNCAITVQRPDGVAISFPDVGFSSSQDNCFDISATGFTGVTEFSFTIFLPLDFDFSGFTAAVPGISAMEIPNSGLVQFTYNGNGAALTIPDGGSLGSVCYRATPTASPGTCAELGVSTIFPYRVVTTESGVNSVDLESLNGEACVLFPNGFGLIVGDATGFVSDQVCVPVSVTRFTDVTDVSVAFSFPPALTTYSSINLTGNWPGLTLANFDETNVAIGRLDMNWSTTNPAGLNIIDQDTLQVFEICFDTGANDGCLNVVPSDGAMPATTTATGPGSIIYRSGEICLEDRIILLSIIPVPASCEGSDDGMIIFETAPRPNNEDLTIRTTNPIRFGNNGSVGGLLPGTTDYVIYNSTGLQYSGTIDIGVNPDNAAVANAGNDGMLTCGPTPSTVINGRNNTGVDWELFIVLSDGVGTRRVAQGTISNDGNMGARVDDPGTYILQVTSEAGCTDRDTVVISPGLNPVAVAPQDTALTCNGDGVLLSGAGSSEAANVAYRWERVTLAGDVIETVGTTRDVTATEPGRYRLTVTFTTLMCSAEDMVIVRDENNLPNSTLPTEAALSCDGSPVMLTTGSPEADVVYTWRRSGETLPLSGNNTYTTSELGTYVVDLTNSVTGCSRSDTVVVVPSQGVPAVDAPGVLTISCNPDTTLLPITYQNVGADTRYSWQPSDGGRVVITDLNAAQPRVTRAGTYQVIVSNGACRDTSLIVVGDAALPSVEAGNDVALTCQEDLRLTGSGIAGNAGATLSPQWYLNDAPLPMGAALSIVVTQPGTYYLEMTDDVTGCVGTDSVVVSAPVGFPVYELADTIRGLGCAPTTVRLEVTGAQIGNYQITWNNPAGNEIGNGTNVLTSEPGVHVVSITNPATGCTAVDSVVVIDDLAMPPFVSFRQNILDLTCEGGPVIIDAASSSQGPSLTYLWEVVSGGEEPATQGNDSLRVRTAGVYRLTITNQTNSCSDSREVTVTDSRVYPMVEAVEGMQLDCDTRSTVIGVNILDQPNDYVIQWSGRAEVNPLPRDTNRITVTVGGTYNAVIINPATSCVETIVIRVEDLTDSIATLAIMVPDSFDCNNSTITIDASDSELNNADPTGIVWTSFDGNNITPASGSLIVSVDGPGDYELAVTDASGCTVRDTVTVVASLDTPFAQAGDPVEVECGEMPQLDGSASTPAPGAGILYSWSASNGGEIISGADTPTPFVGGPGSYQLVVTNLANGCADTSTTMVMLNEQVAATLPADFTACTPPVTVTGNLPPGTSGVWTAFNDNGSVWSADENVATISEIGDGLSLVWTLSAGMGCENYSADTIMVGPEDTPIANNDVLEVGGSDNIGSVNLLTNDMRTGPVTVTLLTQPEFGEIIVDLNGDVTFEAPLGLDGITTVEYQICSNTCPDLCDQATLTIRSSADGATPDVFNAFTPNGDGMNDRFVFTLLDLQPDEFPDNEMIIFNRWGDIIFQAKPYNNDWEGTGTNGAPVPEGTYYYILRLNVGEGDIIRGDVTVIR